MAKRAKCTKPKKKGRKSWMKLVMCEYRKNKKGGLKSAMRRAKKKWR